MYSYMTDAEGRILSVAPGDLSGCSDWHLGEIGLTNGDDLFDERGAALYRLENGRATPRSEEERRADWPPEEEPEADAGDFEEALRELGVRIE